MPGGILKDGIVSYHLTYKAYLSKYVSLTVN
jgi:hypothetical protein